MDIQNTIDAYKSVILKTCQKSNNSPKELNEALKDFLLNNYDNLVNGLKEYLLKCIEDCDTDSVMIYLATLMNTNDLTKNIKLS